MVLTDEQRKERKAISDKKRYNNNKEKALERNKKWRENNKEKIALKTKKYYLNNKEKINQFRLDNPKTDIISNWKRRGVIDDDFNGLYNYFITQTNCWICDKVYNNDIVMDRRCLDHDHDITDDNNVRYICCWNCNINIIR
tara:strand:+ start:182 stop:604 length:423 start_codon:yes stop_codon:yes gene_type:complete